MRKLENKDIITVKRVGAALCIFSALIEFFLFWLFKENRNFTISIIIIISFSNMIFSIASLLPSGSDFTCQIQSFTLNTFQLIQYFFSCILCYKNLVSLIKKNHIEKHKYVYYTIFFLIAFGFSFGFSILILVTESYGSCNGYCWLDLKTESKHTFVNKLALNFFACLWFLLVLHIYFITKVHCLVSKNHKQNKTLYYHLNIYGIIIVLSAIPASVNRIYGILNNGKERLGMKLVQVIFENFCGLAFNINFICSPWIRQSIMNAFYSARIKKNIGYIRPTISGIDSMISDEEEEVSDNQSEKDRED